MTSHDHGLEGSQNGAPEAKGHLIRLLLDVENQSLVFVKWTSEEPRSRNVEKGSDRHVFRWPRNILDNLKQLQLAKMHVRLFDEQGQYAHASHL